MFLWAALALAVPLMLHLLRRRRRERVLFPTLRFLHQAQRRSARRVRIENLLLWIVRTLLLACLVLAFSMPVLRLARGGDWLGRTRRDVALVLDVSASLAYNDGGGPVWNRVRAAAISVVRGLDTGDRVCVFLAGNPARPLFERPTADHEAVISALRAQSWGHEGSRLDEALALASAALRNSGSREREIHVLTDGQAVPWRGFRAAAGTAPPAVVDSGVSCFVMLAGAEKPSNSWIETVAPVPPIPLAGQPAGLLVRVGRCGVRGNTTLTLEMDGRPGPTRTLPEDAESLRFALPPQVAGNTVLRLRLPHDALPEDDEFSLFLHVRERLPVLCAGPDAALAFLTTALDPASHGEAVARVAPEALAKLDLAPFETLFLADALPLSGQAMLALEKFVRRGGVLVLFPGNRGSAEGYAAWSLLPAAPAEFATLPADAGAQTLRPGLVPDPMIAGLQLSSGRPPSLGIHRLLRFPALPADSSVLLSIGNGKPFLLARTVGRGRVLLFAVSADRQWSSLPVTPLFLPLLHQIVRYGAGPGAHAPALPPQHGQPLSELVAGWHPGDKLLSPAGTQLAIRPSTSGSGSVVDAVEPGIYRCVVSGGSAGEPVFAIRPEPGESDLTPVAAEALESLTGIRQLHAARSMEELGTQIQACRQGRPLVEPLLWLALMLATLEWWLANRIYWQRLPRSGNVAGASTTGAN